MNFRGIAATLKTAGYSPRKAEAKTAHDIVLKAIDDAGFHDQVTIKGGVVMSGITDAVRRATIRSSRACPWCVRIVPVFGLRLPIENWATPE